MGGAVDGFYCGSGKFMCTGYNGGVIVIFSLISRLYLLTFYMRMQAGIVYLGCVSRTKKGDFPSGSAESLLLCQSDWKLLLLAGDRGTRGYTVF